MNLLNKILIGFSVVLMVSSCSKLEDTIAPPVPELVTHKDGNIDPQSPDFHGNIIRLNNWNMNDCVQCHGGDYTGGLVSVTCFTCHTEPTGPEACNTCHGDFDNINIIAPPQDTNNNTDTEIAGVGAHQVHMYDNDLGSTIECTTCHIVPDEFEDVGHIDTTPGAEINFNNLAVHNIASNPNYNSGSATCSNTYCHGNFEYLKDNAPDNHKFAYEDGADRMVGNNQSVVWNDVGGSQAECGSCHGLPPIGHRQDYTRTSCGTCHSGIFDKDGNLVDSLSYKHINGEIDVNF